MYQYFSLINLRSNGDIDQSMCVSKEKMPFVNLVGWMCEFKSNLNLSSVSSVLTASIVIIYDYA